MGSSSSKPARSLGSSVRDAVPSAAGASSRAPPGAVPRARVPPAQPQAAPQQQQQEMGRAGRSQLGADQTRTAPQAQKSRAEASESKNAAIMADARDPHLLANLAKLGPVQVPRHKLRYRPNDEMLGILRARSADTERFEADSSSPSSPSSSAAVEGSASRTPNRLTAPTLIALLDARKTATTQREIRQLAHAFDVDLEVLESLVKYVNSPSVRPRPEEVRVEDEDDRPPLVDAVWTEPRLSAASLEAPAATKA